MRKRSYKPEDVKLNTYEQELEDALDIAALQPLSSHQAAVFKEAAHATLEEAKSERTNIRLSKTDMALLKAKADTEGLGYQTLLGQIVHLYVTDQFIKAEEIEKLARIKAVKMRQVMPRDESTAKRQMKISGRKISAKVVTSRRITKKLKHGR